MTVNYKQVQEQIQSLAAEAPERLQELAKRRAMAEELLHGGTLDLENLTEKVQTIARKHDQNLRCAVPVSDTNGSFPPLTTHITLPEFPKQATILAADGSQILPDRHAEVYFGLINISAIQMRYGESTPPQTTSTSQLFYDPALQGVSEATLSLQRDLNERLILVNLAAKAQPPVITFTDGPLELWGTKESTGEFQKSLQAYLQLLENLSNSNTVTAGYVDRPAANLVVRLLEISLLPQDHLFVINQHSPLQGVQDIHLFAGVLAPGERSCVFGIQSRSSINYSGALGLHFFYLNVGREGHPWPVRVEIPAWVIADETMLNDLHSTLVHQCHIMGQRPYPYLLHRAHELAVVSFEDAQQVSHMISMELQRHGVPFGELSYKQSAKNLGGRTRLER